MTCFTSNPVRAQTSPGSDILRDTQPPSLDRPPEVQPLPVLPPPEELLPTPAQPPDTSEPLPGEVPAVINVTGYVVEGSTVFTPAELEAVTRDYVGQVSFAQLLQARSAVTQFYTSRGYVTSGAFIPPQTLSGGVVTIQVIEGRVEEINITGNRRLDPDYVRDRLAIAAAQPLNVNRLLEGLQLLQLDPLIQNLSADLEAGARPGTSVLQVRVTEADTVSAEISADNGRSPSVGTFRRQVQFTQANLLGQGDGLSVGYTNTDGSNGLDASYTYPINPRNGTLRISAGTTSSEVIEPPFDTLDIQADSRYLELTLRQPLAQSPTEEFAIGLTASRQESQTELGIDDIGPFPLSPGADEEGRTRITALRFFQEWTKRSSRQVLAARSQFSLGLDLLDSTVNEGAPDSRFLAWRGQGQWVRLLAPETLLLVRADVQLSGDSLVPLEQFGLGGQESVRGYRQDALLTDSGILASAELRIPILRVPEWQGILQVVPFVDAGTAWNNSSDDPTTDTLLGVGVGLLWRQGDNLTARLDWGIPLVDLDSSGRTWQEDGIYFSISYSPF
ncbi:MAG: ShlB/FhaC/HecB family hemolysin secretion/activation protein [Oculatellaceae cyanobacterium bins.114]|nr:ShlB/FhaC/HecB family hemolysin secretion/activation protein [Oculatellaceae cyanobacterium bins.114]